MPICPTCGAEAVPIIYGMPMPNLRDEADRGEVVLGGCVIDEDSPNWACKGPIQHCWTEPETAEDRA